MPLSLVRFETFPREGQEYEHPESLKYQSEPPPTLSRGGFVLLALLTCGRRFRVDGKPLGA